MTCNPRIAGHTIHPILCAIRFFHVFLLPFYAQTIVHVYSSILRCGFQCTFLHKFPFYFYTIVTKGQVFLKLFKPFYRDPVPELFPIVSLWHPFSGILSVTHSFPSPPLLPGYYHDIYSTTHQKRVVTVTLPPVFPFLMLFYDSSRSSFSPLFLRRTIQILKTTARITASHTK